MFQKIIDKKFQTPQKLFFTRFAYDDYQNKNMRRNNYIKYFFDFRNICQKLEKIEKSGFSIENWVFAKTPKNRKKIEKFQKIPKFSSFPDKIDQILGRMPASLLEKFRALPKK